MGVVEAVEAPTVAKIARVEQPLVGAEEIKAEIRRVFGQRAKNALCIAEHESGFRADAVGWNQDAARSHDRGVFQINSYWHREVPDSEAYDARKNIQHAYRISEGGKYWSQWSTRKYCGV